MAIINPFETLPTNFPLFTVLLIDECCNISIKFKDAVIIGNSNVGVKLKPGASLIDIPKKLFAAMNCASVNCDISGTNRSIFCTIAYNASKTGN